MFDLLTSLLTRARSLFYDNSTSGLTADNVQDAIDEIVSTGAGQPYTTLTDPALDSITQNIIDSNGGVVITLTAAGNDQILPAPTDTSIQHEFTVINNDTSTDTINIIGATTVTLDPGKRMKWTWDETAWASSDADGLWIDDGTSLKAEQSTRNIDLQNGSLVSSNSGLVTLGGIGGTNNESITFDFETTANTISMSSSTGATDLIWSCSDFTIQGTSSVDGSNPVQMIIQDLQASGTWTGGATMMELLFKGSDVSGIGAGTKSKIKIYNQNTSGGRVCMGLYSSTSALTEMITLYGDQYVGIKNTNPTVELDVNGEGAFSGDLTIGDGTDGYNEIKDSTGTTRVYLDSIGDSYITYGLGIGTSSLNATLTVDGSQSGKRTDAGAADYNPSALTEDYIVTANNTAAVRAITISTEDVQSGTPSMPRIMVIQDYYGQAGSNAITVSLESGTINGAASVLFNNAYDSMRIALDGTNATVL